VCACISIKDAGVVEKHKRRFDTTTAQLRELVAWLQQHQVSRVAMEATSSIINTGAVVEHDCAIGECSHIAVRACIAGRSRLGDCVFLGAGAVVIDSISIASHVIIGAGGVVVAAIDSPGVYAGVPVRRIANRASVS
jgi:serine acetyltransferase